MSEQIARCMSTYEYLYEKYISKMPKDVAATATTLIHKEEYIPKDNSVYWTEEQLKDIKKRRNAGQTYAEIAKHYKVRVGKLQGLFHTRTSRTKSPIA